MGLRSGPFRISFAFQSSAAPLPLITHQPASSELASSSAMADDEGAADIWLLDATSVSGYAVSSDPAHPETLVNHTISELDVQVAQTLETHPFPYFLQIILLPRNAMPSKTSMEVGVSLLLPLDHILNITIADHGSHGQSLRFRLAPAPRASWVIRQIMTAKGPGQVYGPNEEDPYRLLGILRFRELVIRNSGGGNWAEIVGGWAGCIKRNSQKHFDHHIQVLKEDCRGMWSMMDTAPLDFEDQEDDGGMEELLDLKVDVDEDPMDETERSSPVDLLEDMIVVAPPKNGSTKSTPRQPHVSLPTDVSEPNCIQQNTVDDTHLAPSQPDKVDVSTQIDGNRLGTPFSYASRSPDHSCDHSEPYSPPIERNDRSHLLDNRETSPDEDPFSREPSRSPTVRRQYKRPYHLPQNRSDYGDTQRHYTHHRPLTGPNSINLGAPRYHLQPKYSSPPTQYTFPRYSSQNPHPNHRYTPYRNYSPPPRYHLPNTKYHSYYRGSSNGNPRPFNNSPPRQFNTSPPRHFNNSPPRPSHQFTPRFRPPYAPRFPIRHVNSGTRYDSYRPRSCGSPEKREDDPPLREYVEHHGTKRKPRIERRD